MATERTRIPVREFSDNIPDVLARVLHGGETIEIVTETGEIVMLSPTTTSSTSTKSGAKSGAKSEEAWQAFHAAAGSWRDVDTDAFLDNIYESRRSSRPPVDL